MPASWVAAAGAALGGVAALTNDGGGGGSGSTTSKEPWAEAAPWLKDLIAKGQTMEGQYAANPFNAQQQQAYNNTFSDINDLRSNVVPTMNGVANNMLGQNHQRAPQRQGFNGGASGALGMAPTMGQPSPGLMGSMGYQGSAAPSPLQQQGMAPPPQRFANPGASAPSVGANGLFAAPFGPPGAGASPYPVAPPPAPAAPAAPAPPPYDPYDPYRPGQFYQNEGDLYTKNPFGYMQNFYTADFGTGNGGA